MTPIEDSQSSEELLATEDNTSTAPLPSNSSGVRTNIRVRNVSELNNNNEAEATPSNASAPAKRRCLPSWMLNAQGNSANKKKKPDSAIETPESTSSPSTSKIQLEKEDESDLCESSNQNINETNDSSTVDSSGARENDSNLNEQMEIESSSIHNDEAGNNANVEAEEASVASSSKFDKNPETVANSDANVASTSNAKEGAEEDKKDDSEVDGNADVASSSNQSSSPSKVTIKTEPKDDDNEAVGQVTATSPKDIKPAVKVEKEEATSSTTRVSCKFGIRCYRRNQMHRVEEAHPGDSDYRRPDFPTPPDGTPPCPYGDLCYRRNPVHFQQYTHPASTDFKQNWKLHQMRLRDRKKNQQPKVDPDSDDDDEEVFIDSSEEFDIGDEIDDDDDEEESEDFY